MRHLKCRRQIQLDHRVPFGTVEVTNLLRKIHSRTIHQYVYCSEDLDTMLYHLLRDPFICQIHFHENIAGTRLFNNLLRRPIIIDQARNKDIRTTLRERQREGTPDAGVASCDDG